MKKNGWMGQSIFLLRVGLLLAAMSVCVHAQDDRQELTFKAEMIVKQEGISSLAKVWARPGLLRMETAGGRAATRMIAHYDEGKAWALIPEASTYQEFPVASLRSSVPHFFDPGLQFRGKKEVARETIDAVPAIKYEVDLIQEGRGDYLGFLWEAESLPGYPLKWQDRRRSIEATWRHAEMVEVSDGFFELPAGYTEQKTITGGSGFKKERCRKTFADGAE